MALFFVPPIPLESQAPPGSGYESAVEAAVDRALPPKQESEGYRSLEPEQQDEAVGEGVETSWGQASSVAQGEGTNREEAS